MCTLQEHILNDILGERHGYKIKDRDRGAEIIQERCCRKKVLLVLDDVNDVMQLEFLAATREWFGPGSRIIITTRDQHLLSYADEKYKPATLSGDRAVELFSRHAFNERSPPDGYEDLSFRAIHHAGGLPLALEVLGSFFRGRKANVWESALQRLAKTQDNKIFRTLKLSFDDLGDSEQNIFLDIACFYKGKDVDEVTRILDSFGFDPDIGISVLVEKSLITISSNNKLDMHDLIQEMGRKEVQASSPNSRLWEPEKFNGLINFKKLESVEGIVLPREEIKESLNANVFESMKNLRLLDCYQNFTSGEPTFLPDQLRWFCWNHYPFSSLPIADMSKLVGLEMEWGKIEHLWKGKKVVYSLRNPISTYLAYITRAPNIESLHLRKCYNLVEVDESVGSLKKLLYLDIHFCNKLKCFPSMLQMESLKSLNLSWCWSLKRIPEFSPCMVNLSKLDISYSKEIEELPWSIKLLSNLIDLNVKECDSLKNIPNSIWELKCLKTFNLTNCGKLQKLPDDLQIMESLEELHIDTIHFHAFTNFCYLRKIYLDGPYFFLDFKDNDFPKNLHGLSSLEELYITFNHKLIQLPESISHLSSLKHLWIQACNGLETLHGLPPGIQHFGVKGCYSLQSIEDLSKEYECLNNIQISICPKLLEYEENGRYLDKMLDQSFLKKRAAVDGCLTLLIPGRNVPSWFKEQQDGRKIALKLPPNWQTEIIGFAVCCVTTMPMFPDIKMRFENDEMLVSKSEANYINETEEADWNVWTGYLPYSLFEQFHGGNDNDFEGEDWFHMTQGRVVFEVYCPIDSEYKHAVRCGANVVYKEDVASIQQTTPSISSFDWSWKLTKEFTNSFKCTTY
uniref:disease resistance protein Roq1-like n=1 Tax=Erigeron canadensis TaxID=72917 RepID=UPI001CB9A8F5|nr:disease resistance protein Roq1-like [Erigeron canadensis]